MAEKSAARSEITYGTGHHKTNTRHFAAIDNYFAAGELEKTLELGTCFIEQYAESNHIRITMTRIFITDALLHLGRLDEAREMSDIAIAELANQNEKIQYFLVAYAKAMHGKLLLEKGEDAIARKFTMQGKLLFTDFDNPKAFPWVNRMGERILKWEKEAASTIE